MMFLEIFSAQIEKELFESQELDTKRPFLTEKAFFEQLLVI